MVGTVRAFCPGHISGYFRRVQGESNSGAGSIGAGIVVSEGVTASVVKADTPHVTIRRIHGNSTIQDEFQGSPPIEYIMEKLEISAEVITECRLPISAGFGMSAAALLSSITAMNALFGLSLSVEDIASLAHEAEIVHRTGLGDVAACKNGGLVCRTGQGINTKITRLYGITEPISAVNFGPMNTADVLDSDDIMKRIESAYSCECPKDIYHFFQLSRDFAEKSGLISENVNTALAACDAEGIPASMTMLGDGLFAYGERSIDVLSRFGEVFVMKTAKTGFHLLEEIP